MLRFRIAPMLALLVLLSVSLPSHAFFDPPWIRPEIPMAGDYTLTVELAYIDYFEGPSILTIGVVPFTVAAAPAPVTVPTLDMLGMLVLLVFVVSMGGWMLRARRLGLLVLALTCFPLGVRAQDMGTIRVLLSNAPRAPTPDSVLAWVNSSTRAAMPAIASAACSRRSR